MTADGHTRATHAPSLLQHRYPDRGVPTPYNCMTGVGAYPLLRGDGLHGVAPIGYYNEPGHGVWDKGVAGLVRQLTEGGYEVTPVAAASGEA